MSYTIGTFGREAEYLVALYLRMKGWRVRLSKNSLGPADIVAVLDSKKKRKIWLIQVKSSRTIPRIRGYEILRLIAAASVAGGDPIIATLGPVVGNSTGRLTNFSRNTDQGLGLMLNDKPFAITFFCLPDWRIIRPSETIAK